MNDHSLKSILSADLYRYSTGLNSVLGMFRGYYIYPGFRFTFWYRIAKYMLTCRTTVCRVLFPVVRWQYKRTQLATGIQIPLKAEIGEGLYIPHFGGIVVSTMFRAGKNLYLSHNVTIGKVHIGERKGAPVCGDGVYIGAGAVLFGAIKLGDNVAIGANSVVIRDVASNIFAVGSPARIVSSVGAIGIIGNIAEFDGH